MYTLKSIAQRSTALGTAFAFVVAAIVPAAAVFADALNPLTERSLLLSSSAPGFQDTDGSGNSTDVPNAVGETYAPAGSGPNGKKTGETFSFKVSSDSTTRALKGITFQYCTLAAGNCRAPGDNIGDGSDTDSTSDLNVNYTNPVAGTDFEVYVNGENESADWVMTTKNAEDPAYDGPEVLDQTGKKNFITLAHADGVTPSSGQQIRVVFKATETNYITNPGSGSFFVKINTFDSDLTADHSSDETNTHLIDGGVTVANVMTDSIHITTKVLETMSFSVGTRNRDTVQVATSGQPGYENDNAVHGTCDPVQTVDGNRLNLGNPNAEYSLETDKAWDVNSYWRLSSNSSGGATVYYSGNTLANTVGDQIAPIGPTAASSTPGTEQFGLAFLPASGPNSGETFDPAFTALVTAQPARYKNPSITSDNLVPGAQYANGVGNIQTEPEDEEAPTAAFAFEQESNTVPRVIATNNQNVISCATAKMRYVGNIGADTPAGVYTTKINYLAAPQY